MDGHHFDNLTRQLARRSDMGASGVVTRRTVLAGIVGGLVGAMTGRGADAQQASCGNVSCRTNPARCASGCVCCVYGNGNSRCTPPRECGSGTVVCPPGQVVGPSGACVAATTTTTTTTAAPTTTLAPATTTAAPTTTPAPTTTTTQPPSLLPYGSPCAAPSQCQSGVCTAMSCDCSPAERLCGGRCIPALSCCVDEDCGFDAICQRAACNQVTNTCGVANTDSDPLCVSDTCATRACSGGACVSTPIVECPFCQTCSGGACVATGSDPRCAGQCESGRCTNVPLGGTCTDALQCGIDDSTPLLRCGGNGFDDDGASNCCSLGRGFCANDRHCCFDRVCVSGECLPPT